jgi:hypothetical protein
MDLKDLALRYIRLERQRRKDQADAAGLAMLTAAFEAARAADQFIGLERIEMPVHPPPRRGFRLIYGQGRLMEMPLDGDAAG